MTTVHRFWDDLSPHGPPIDPTWSKRVIENDRLHTVTDWECGTLPPDIIATVRAHTHDVADGSILQHRANIVRLALLVEFGGIWMDHDFLPLERIAPPPSGQPLLAAHASGRLCNCFIAVRRPGHPLLVEALKRATTTPSMLRTFPSDQLSGEGMLNELAKDHYVHRRTLPHEADGAVNPRVYPWCVHLYGSSSS